MKTQLSSLAAILSLTAAGLSGQGGGARSGQAGQPDAQSQRLSFQDAATLANAPIQVLAGGRGGSLGTLVTGSPVSAREVNKTVQTLSDGTQIENTRTTLFYRDSQGRTRSEPTTPDAPVQIMDPVAGVRITINPSNRTAVRLPAPGLAGGAGGGAGRGGPAAATPLYALEYQLRVLNETMAQARGTTPVNRNQNNTEELGSQMQNGVMAQGTRTTLTIPQGQIGNNRDIHVVNERWYSKELQMLVKTINSDPRFGVTTYDLTNIVPAADPSLFQIPAGYTVTEGPAGAGARGGR